MTVQDVIGAIDEWAPPGLAYGWDRIGLHAGDPRSHVSAVLVTLSVTRDAFEAAQEANASMIVSHHPLIWEPLKTLRRDDPISRLCLDVAESGIACYAAHTNLDVVPGGVNEVLADQLALLDWAPLLPVPQAKLLKLITFVPDENLPELRDALSRAGAGTIGDYTHCSFSSPGIGTFLPGEGANPYSGRKLQVNEEEERRFETLLPKARLKEVLAALLEVHPYEEPAYDLLPLENSPPEYSLGLRGLLKKARALGDFASHVRKALDISHVRVTGDVRREVRSVAVLGGAGGSAINDIPADVDVFVTGDVKYHEAQTALERGIAVIDAGHHGTEKLIVPVIARYLKSVFGDLHVATYTEPDVFQVVTR